MSNPIKLRCLDDSSENMLVVSTNTRASTNASTGALVIHKGGLSINSTENAVNSSAGGALTVGGGAAFGQDIMVGGDMTVGNINLTGELFQNGESYASSQWTTTSGNVTYTSGNVEIVDLTAGNINLTGTLYQNGAPYASSQWTNTAGNVSYTSGTVVATDLQTTNFTVGNFVGDNFSAGNLVASALNLGVSSVFSGSFAASNNVSSPANVDGLSFDSSITSFNCQLMANIDATTNLYENFTLSGNKTDSGWNLYLSSIGDVSGVEFTITSGGQVQYTSTNLAGFVSSTFRYSCTQISESGTYTAVNPSTSGTYIYNTLQVSGTQDAVSGVNNGSLYVQGGATFEKNLIVGTSLSANGNSNTLGSLITTGGNVGIGTSDPTSILEVLGQSVFTNSNANAPIKVKNSTSNSGAVFIDLTNNNGNQVLTLSDGDSGSPASLTSVVSGGLGLRTLNAPIVFFNRDSNLGALSERMRITPSGNVGIGTSSPTQMLHLRRTGNMSNYIKIDSGSGNGGYSGIMLSEDNLNWGWSFRHNSVTDNLHISYQDDTPTFTDFITFDRGNARMGVGTTAPAEKLHVDGNILLGPSTSDSNVVYSITTPGQLLIGANNASTQDQTYLNLTLRSGISSNQSNIDIYGSSNDSYKYISFATANTERMRVSSSGNVGIGTTSPLTRLHVNDDSNNNVLRISGNTSLQQGIEFFDTAQRWSIYKPSNSTELRFWNGSNDAVIIPTSGNVTFVSPAQTDSKIIGRHATASSTGEIILYEQGTGNLILKSNFSTASVALHTNGSEGMRINASGNVGINTSSPEHKLHVSGGNIYLSGDPGSFPVYQVLTGTTDGGGMTWNDDSKTLDLQTINAASPIAIRGSQVHILPSGNIGIGTTSPSSLFHISNTSADCIVNMTCSDNKSNTLIFNSATTSRVSDLYFNSDSSINYRQKSDGSYPSRFAIGANGNVGIGISGPGAKLEVIGTSSSGYSVPFRLTNSASTSFVWDIGPNGPGDFVIFNNTTGVWLNKSNPGAGWNLQSDLRLKENIEPLESSLEKVMLLNPVKFNWKADQVQEHKTFGLIAQEAKEILPEIVNSIKDQNNEDIYGVQYTSLIPILLGAIKELKLENDQLKSFLQTKFPGEL